VTFFVDANVIVYAGVPGPMYEACGEVLDAIADGADGRTSTAALEEVWHLELSGRIGDIAGITEKAYTALTPLLPVADGTVARALALDAEQLDANDRIHLATCLENGIETIVTADADFDGIRGLRRVDPLDRRALLRVLGS
jgi:predicted nucleic acid-binding protein